MTMTAKMIATPTMIVHLVVIYVVIIATAAISVVTAFEVLKDINPGRPSSYPNDFIHLTSSSSSKSSCRKQEEQQQQQEQQGNDQVLFFVEDVDYGDNQAGPWMTDGTKNGTTNVTATRLKDSATAANNMNPNAVVMTKHGHLYYMDMSGSLWYETQLLHEEEEEEEVSEDETSSYNQNLNYIHRHNEEIYFTSKNGTQLWKVVEGEGEKEESMGRNSGVSNDDDHSKLKQLQPTLVMDFITGEETFTQEGDYISGFLSIDLVDDEEGDDVDDSNDGNKNNLLLITAWYDGIWKVVNEDDGDGSSITTTTTTSSSSTTRLELVAGSKIHGKNVTAIKFHSSTSKDSYYQEYHPMIKRRHTTTTTTTSNSMNDNNNDSKKQQLIQLFFVSGRGELWCAYIISHSSGIVTATTTTTTTSVTMKQVTPSGLRVSDVFPNPVIIENNNTVVDEYRIYFVQRAYNSHIFYATILIDKNVVDDIDYNNGEIIIAPFNLTVENALPELVSFEYHNNDGGYELFNNYRHTFVDSNTVYFDNVFAFHGTIYPMPILLGGKNGISFLMDGHSGVNTLMLWSSLDGTEETTRIVQSMYNVHPLTISSITSWVYTDYQGIEHINYYSQATYLQGLVVPPPSLPADAAANPFTSTSSAASTEHDSRFIFRIYEGDQIWITDGGKTIHGTYLVTAINSYADFRFKGNSMALISQRNEEEEAEEDGIGKCEHVLLTSGYSNGYGQELLKVQIPSSIPIPAPPTRPPADPPTPWELKFPTQQPTNFAPVPGYYDYDYDATVALVKDIDRGKRSSWVVPIRLGPICGNGAVGGGGSGSVVGSMVGKQNWVWFVAGHASPTPENAGNLDGFVPWVSDGTPENTFEIFGLMPEFQDESELTLATPPIIYQNKLFVAIKSTYSMDGLWMVTIGGGEVDDDCLTENDDDDDNQPPSSVITAAVRVHESVTLTTIAIFQNELYYTDETNRLWKLGYIGATATALPIPIHVETYTNDMIVGPIYSMIPLNDSYLVLGGYSRGVVSTHISSDVDNKAVTTHQLVPPSTDTFVYFPEHHIMNGRLYFALEFGCTIYSTDGTLEGTYKIGDLDAMWICRIVNIGIIDPPYVGPLLIEVGEHYLFTLTPSSSGVETIVPLNFTKATNPEIPIDRQADFFVYSNEVEYGSDIRYLDSHQLRFSGQIYPLVYDYYGNRCRNTSSGEATSHSNDCEDFDSNFMTFIVSDVIDDDNGWVSLWITDGTVEKTTMIASIPYQSSWHVIRMFDSRYLLASYHQDQIWMVSKRRTGECNDSQGGCNDYETSLVTEIERPQVLVALNETEFLFLAYDEPTGNELWKLRIPPITPSEGGDIAPTSTPTTVPSSSLCNEYYSMCYMHTDCCSGRCYHKICRPPMRKGNKQSLSAGRGGAASTIGRGNGNSIRGNS